MVFGFIAEEKVPSPEVVQVIEEALPLNEALTMLRRSLHIVVSFPASTNAAGSTVISRVIESPIQAPRLGGYFYRSSNARPSGIAERKEAMFPVPEEEGNPIDVALIDGVASH